MRTKKGFPVLTFSLAAVLALLFLFPLYWMLATSLKLNYKTTIWPPDIFPRPLTLANYGAILQNTVDTPVLRWFMNSLVAATGFTVGAVGVSSLAAYALSRLRFAGRDAYFWLCLASMVIPGIIFLIPNYLTVNTLGWIDTYPALIFPGLAATSGVFLMRQYFLGIPTDLEDAARIDGAGRLGIFVHVVLPASKAVLLTFGLMSFLGNWNDYLWALIVTSTPQMRTLPVGILTLQGRYIHLYGNMMAGGFLTALPAMLLFLFVQRYFVKGIVMTGLKS
ncbi:MAG: carbohydrate ABC transporter permease [Bacteroidota bacterium]